MKTIKSILAGVLGLAIMVCGCTNNNDNLNSGDKDENTYVVAVGMEMSDFAGSCPGAEIDAKRMSKVFSAYTDNVKTFISEQATKGAVVSAMKDAAAKAELFIFYYSGHGGSQPAVGAEKLEEVDGNDEFFCLYDTLLEDNEVWEIIKDRTGRTMIIADCCHSETIFKLPIIIDFHSHIPMAATTNMEGTQNLLVWAGCPDNTYSYGGSDGGKFTNTLLKYLDGRKTYDYLWTEMENDKGLQDYQMIQRTIIGSGFIGRPVFK